MIDGFCPFDDVRLEQRGSPAGGHCPICGKDYSAQQDDKGREVSFSECLCPTGDEEAQP